jgi:DNA-binding response OmpR family regulator
VELETLPVVVAPVELDATPVVVSEPEAGEDDVVPELAAGAVDVVLDPVEVDALFEAALAAAARAAAARVRAASCCALFIIAFARRFALVVAETTMACSAARAARTIWVAWT